MRLVWFAFLVTAFYFILLMTKKKTFRFRLFPLPVVVVIAMGIFSSGPEFSPKRLRQATTAINENLELF